MRSQFATSNWQWYFAFVDVIAVLTQSADAIAYCRKLKERLKKEGNETVTNCNASKMTAADGKQRLTDVANTEQLLRLVQSIPQSRTLQALARPFPRLVFLCPKKQGTYRFEAPNGKIKCPQWPPQTPTRLHRVWRFDGHQRQDSE